MMRTSEIEGDRTYGYTVPILTREGAGKCDKKLERLGDPTERKALERRGAHR